jgi:transposase InsO family protein/transposase-like protein
MPWKDRTAMSERREFVVKSRQIGANISQLCHEYGISRTTGYKWLRRFDAEGEQGLQEQSRRPHRSPNKASEEIEEVILEVRSQFPSWGGVKIIEYLKRNGWQKLPAASTVTAILHRHNQIDPAESCKHKAIQRFEWAAPNDLWQMDFKGYFHLAHGRCCPLTILDDHSRFLVGLHACPDQSWHTVQIQLTNTFRQYGLPHRMLMDNGSPWGDFRESPHTILTSWLMRLDIDVSHGRPYHPQTQGKDERLHRTLQAELLSRDRFRTLPECQKSFDHWREFYNYERPHQALGHSVPADRYQSSERCFPEKLPPITYQQGFIVRIVDTSGRISFHNQSYRISKAFQYLPVGLRPTEIDGDYDVFFGSKKVAQISLRNHNKGVKHVPEEM